MTPPLPSSHAGLWRRSCLEVARRLACTRASVWVFEPGEETIRCVCLIDLRSGRTTAGQRILRSQHPAYFEALLQGGHVRAGHAHEDPATRSFVDSYFFPNGILSLLDHLIVDDDGPLGLLCCEHCDEPRLWTEDDARLLANLADDDLIEGLQEQRELSPPQPPSWSASFGRPPRRKGDRSSNSST